MNLILLESSDFVAPGRAVLFGRRHQHITEVHRAQAGEQLKVGLVNGEIGNATVRQADAERIELDVALHQAPPPALPLTMVLALPRPKMLKRTIQHEILDPLALMMIDGEVKDGATVKVGVKGDKIVIG